MKKAARLSWIAIWFGTIMVVRPEPFAHWVGFGFWGVGCLVQIAAGIGSINSGLGKGLNAAEAEHTEEEGGLAPL